MASTTTKPLLTDLLAENCSSVPSGYVRPASDRPVLLGVKASGTSIPLIDVDGLRGPGRAEVVKAIGLACQNDGFFQVKKHGVPGAVVANMLRVAREFFRLPEAERTKYFSDDPMKKTRLSTSFNVKTEKVRSWRDYLRLHCHPLEDFVHDWPSQPHNFREVVSEYCGKVREMVLRILEAISESLGLEDQFLNNALGSHSQQMAINYYPPCPQPHLTYGLPAHKDPNAITVLLQDHVPGLQVLRRGGHWVSVDPIPDSFIINIGDQMQVLSNERYKSVLHRAVVNGSAERISIPTFYCPSMDAVMRTPDALVDGEHPEIYRSYSYGEYYEKFWDRGLNSESCLDLFRIAQ